MMSGKFFISTPIFYVNAKPHIGTALTCLYADVLARYHRQKGEEVFFLTGTDEHGAKIAQSAEKAGLEPQAFVDQSSESFRELMKSWHISNDFFIRTTDKVVHTPGVLKLWQLLADQGDIYKGSYEGLYCVGHEAFMKSSDLVDGKCPDHQTEPEKIKEENYFFKLSKYKKDLREMYEKGDIVIRPDSRRKEILNMLDDLEDISFSRPRDVVKWGIPVPGDDSQLIYVWADALTNYISALGYGRKEENMSFWPGSHMIGKDILKFHAIFWPAMLHAVGLQPPREILAHGFITVDGQKMSKTIGNVIDPTPLVEKYGLDPVRYFLLREIPSHQDGDFSYEKLEARYNGDLANNLGNLVSRVAKLIETKCGGELIYEEKLMDSRVGEQIAQARKDYEKFIEEFKLHEALASIWNLLTFANGYMDEHKPWKEEHGEHLLMTLNSVATVMAEVSKMLESFMPETSAKILKNLGAESDAKKFVITKVESLFPRLEK